MILKCFEVHLRCVLGPDHPALCVPGARRFAATG